MGVFDSYLNEKPRTSGKKATSGGVFDSYLGETVTETPKEVPSEPSFTFDNPSPTARKPFRATPDAGADFASAISSGDFSVSGTPKQEPKKNVVDQVTRGYDQAPDKWKYKRTLTNTELARLDQTRPEHKEIGSVSEAEKERQRKAYSAKIEPSLIQPVTGTSFEAPGKSFSESEMRIEKAKGSITGTVGAKTKNLWDDVFGDTETEKAVSAQQRGADLIASSERETARRATISKEVEEASRKPLDPTTGGEFYKALKQGTLRDVPRSFFSSVEAITAGDGSMKTVNDWAAELSDSFLADKLLHPEENAPESAKAFLEGGYKESDYWKRGAGQMLSTTIPSLALALGVGFVTKNPAAATKVGIGSIYAQESGQAYSDLVDSGFSPIGAQKGALMYGAVATALENVNFGKTLTKVLGPAKTDIARESFKKALVSTMKEMGETVVTESATETAQEFSQNVMKKFYDGNQDLFEGLADAAALGTLGWVGFSSVNAAVDLRNRYLSDPALARDVVLGIKKATDDAKEAASMALSRFQNAVKKTEAKATSGNSSVTVETVTYPDGKVSASAEIETSPGNSVTVPFSEPSETKAEAVEAAISTAETIVSNDPEADVSVISNVREEAIRNFMQNNITNARSESTAKAPEQVKQPVPEGANVTTEAVKPTPAASSAKVEIWVGDNLSPTSARYEQAIAIYESAGISKAIAEKNIERIKAVSEGGKREILHPDNKNSRKVFELLTGLKLPKGVSATNEFISSNIESIRSALQESDKEIKSSEPNPPTNADRPGSVPDAGKQEPIASGGRGEGADTGRAGGEWITSATEPRTGSDDGRDGVSGKELTTAPKIRFGKSARAKLNADVKAILEKKAYSTNPKDYSAEELQAMKEYSGAGGKIDKGAEGRGVLDEFYTPREIVASMFDIASKYLGKPLSDAKILEPSAGVGRFVEAAPNAKNVTAYELDKVSGTILQILHPDAKVGVMDFQTLFIDKGGKALKPQGGYDLIIGNPPYGDRAGLFKGLGEESKVGRWEEYFIKRGLDLLNEDGLLVYIVPSSFLNSKNSKVKENIESQGFLVDAYRMPEGVFEDTQVWTDIIAIRKGIPDMPGEISDGKWFSKNPNKVLGTAIERKDRFGKQETAITGSKEEAMKKLLEMVGKPEQKTKSSIEKAQDAKAEKALSKEIRYDGVVKTKKEWIDTWISEGLKPSEYAVPMEYDDRKRLEFLRSRQPLLFKDLQREYAELEEKESNPSMTYRMGKEGDRTFFDLSKTEYKYAVEQFGKADKPQQKATEEKTASAENSAENKVEIFSITEWPLTGKVQAIVTEWPDKGKVGIGADEAEARSKIGSKVSVTTEKKETKPRTVTKATPETKTVIDVSGIPTVESQTLNVGNATKQELEIFAAQQVDGSITASDFEAHPDWTPYLNYENGRYYHDVNYFSGDIRQRLEFLDRDKKKMEAEQYERQKAGLISVLPEDKKIDEITFDPTDRFVTKIETGKQKRIYNRYGPDSEVLMNVEDAFVDWVQSMDRKLIGYGVQKGDIENFVRGNRQRANTKLITVHIKSESRRLFNQFMRDGLDAETQKKIVSEFNRTKNSYVRPDYDKIPVIVKWMASEYHDKPFELSATQRNGIGFLVNKGSGLVAYGVGVGKTHALLIATKANMDKGWTKRPVFIVPASTLAGWIDTTKRMFPGVKVNNLAGLQAPVVAKLRNTGAPSEWIKDGEITFLTHEGILRLGFDESEILDLTKDLNDALGTFDYKLTTREIEKSKEKAQEVLGQSLRGSTDILMRELGIDHISVDEVHNFRKVFQGAKIEEDGEGKTVERKRFSNVTGGVPSARARKLFLVSQYVQKNNNGRNVFLASATPFENHATEVYNILSFMARERMRAMGIYNINDFYSTFASFQTETVQKSDGSWQEKEVMKSFSNLKQLQSLLQEFIDKKEEKTLVRPEKVVIAPQLKMSPLQAEVKQKIREMIATDDDGVLLKATTYMKANSFSPYFVAEFGGVPKDMYEFVQNSPKVEYAMEMLRALKNDPATAKRSNLVYIGSEGISFTPMYVDYLVKEIGYKRDEIGVITGEVSDEQREDIKSKFNSGKIKVLIGGTPTKEGINLQTNGYATFNLSLGWNPTEMAQVEWRIWRQGNNLNKALIVYPIVENSGDIGIYQKFEEKASRINDLFSYEGDVFDVGEIDPKEKKLLLLTDPLEKANLAIKLEEASLQSRKLYLDSELSELEKAVSELKVAKWTWYIESAITNLKKQLAELPKDSYRIDSVKRDLETYEKELKSAKDKVKRIEEKLSLREISDPQIEIDSLKSQIESVQNSITDSKLSFERLLEKYQLEYDQGILNTKSMEDHRNQILSINSSIVERTPAQLAAEKTRLSNEVSELAMKDEDVSDKGRRASSSAHGLNSGIGTGISKFSDRETSPELTDFKLSDRVKAIIDQFETRFSRYVSPGSVGTFFPKSKNLALRSINEVSVVHHELSHLVDNAQGITASIVSVRLSGRRFATDKVAMKELTKIYVENYPGAKKTDDIEVRAKEGYAVIQQIHLENPARAMKQYPYLYERFVKNAVPMQKELNESMEKLVRDYQSVGAKGRIWAVLSRAINRKSGDQFLSVIERIHEFLTNHVYRFEKLDRMAEKGTLRVSDMLHGSGNVQRRIVMNLTKANAGTWHLNSKGDPAESVKDNIAAIETEIADMGKMDEFSIYLIVRDQHEARIRLKALQAQLEQMKAMMEFMPSREDMQALELMEQKVRSLKTSIKNNEGILSEKDVEETFAELDPMFSEFGTRFDALTRADLKAMLDAGMIKQEYFDELSEQTGYAPMKRLIDDGFIGDNPEFSGFGSKAGKVTKASSMKQRTGGSHDIIDPVVAFAANHKEVMMKTYKQHVLNRVYDSITQFPELSQEVRFRTTNIDGRVTRTLGDGTKLEDAPNVVIKMVDGKPKAVAVREDFAEVLGMAFKPIETGTLEKFFVKSARLFSRGTTGAYPLYTVTNVARDQQTALINTQTNYNPALLPKYAALTLYMITSEHAGDAKYSKHIGKFLSKFAEYANDTTGDAALVKEYLDFGGEHNTSLNFNEMTGDEILSAVTRQRSGLKKTEAMLDAGLDFLSLPSNVSEIATRVQEYVNARKSGKGIFESMELAGRLSVPFHHGGTMMKNAFSRGMVNSVPYMKAAMQGLAQYMDTATRDRKGTARALAAPVVVASMMFAFLLSSLDDTDDETRQAFLNMEPSMLARYLFIPKWNGEFYKIPIDQSIGWLGAMNSMIWAEYKYGANYSVKEYADAMTIWFPDQFKFWQPTKALLSVIPQLLKPSLEIAMNKKTFPTVRDLETESMRKQLPYLRTNPNTSLFATEIAKTNIGKQMGLSPIQIDHLLEGYLGRAVGFATLKPSTYDPKSPFVQPEYFTSGRIIQKFYDTYGTTGTFTQEQNAVKSGEIYRSEEEKASDYARKKRAEDVMEDIGKLRKLEPNTGEFNEIRNRIWKTANELLFDSVEPTEEEVSAFARSEDTAQWKEDKPILVTKYVTEYKGSKEPMKATKLENQLRKEIIGDVKKSDPSYSSLSSRATSAIKEFRLERSGDDFIKETSKLSTNKEKVAAFQRLKEKVGEEEFKKRLKEYQKNELVSDELAKLIRKNK